jgi:hypothetical protein
MLGDVAERPWQHAWIFGAGSKRPDDAREHDTVVSRRERRLATWAHELNALMERRPDLSGVHAAADLAVEAVRWSV